MAANIINTPEAKKKITDAFTEISNSKVRQAAEKDLVKQTIANISEEFDIPKKLVSEMANTFHADSFQNKVAEKTEFEITYEIITGQKPDGEE